ncbi:hypothetical protein [Flavobacterium sp.]|uniref:hypothetical protein n=1 Tax=Flavobacterium sp. TaxID=239 RepID=UPI003D6B6828
MNFITHRNRIEKLMYSYMSFLPLCETNKEKLKLLDEINEIRFKIQRIDRMTMSQAAEDVKTVPENFTSNFEE